VVVEVGVGGSNKVLWDCIAEEDTEDTVLDGVGLVLIESDEDHCVLHEVLVCQQRLQEVTQPLPGYGDRRVMAVRSLEELAIASSIMFHE
jgi:hypothetical protein